MEKELRKNESKGGWLNREFSYYLRRAKFNLDEVNLLDKYNYVIKCLADCSNFCMMVADNLREHYKIMNTKIKHPIPKSKNG